MKAPPLVYGRRAIATPPPIYSDKKRESSVARHNCFYIIRININEYSK